MSIPPRFTYSAAHGISNSVRLVVRLHFVTVFLSVSLLRADGASCLLAGTGYEFAKGNAKFSLTVYSAFTLDGYSGSCTITIGTGDVASRGRCVVAVFVATARRLPQRGRRVRIVSSGAARPRHDPLGRQKTGRMTGTTRQQMGGKKLWETICSAESGAQAQVTTRGIERQFPAVPGCRRTRMPTQVGLAPDIYGIE